MKTFVTRNPTIAAAELERLHKLLREVARTTFDIDAKHELLAGLEKSLHTLYEKQVA